MTLEQAQQDYFNTPKMLIELADEYNLDKNELRVHLSKNKSNLRFEEINGDNKKTVAKRCKIFKVDTIADYHQRIQELKSFWEINTIKDTAEKFNISKNMVAVICGAKDNPVAKPTDRQKDEYRRLYLNTALKITEILERVGISDYFRRELIAETEKSFIEFYGRSRDSMMSFMRDGQYRDFQHVIDTMQAVEREYFNLENISIVQISDKLKLSNIKTHSIINVLKLSQKFRETYKRNRFAPTTSKKIIAKSIKKEKRIILKQERNPKEKTESDVKKMANILIRQKVPNLNDLKPNGCKYPLEDGTWCNEDRGENKSFCEHHRQICYTKLQLKPLDYDRRR